MSFDHEIGGEISPVNTRIEQLSLLRVNRIPKQLLILPPYDRLLKEQSDLLLNIFSFFVSFNVSLEDVSLVAQVCQHWRRLATQTQSLWQRVPDVLENGCLNWVNFENKGITNKGTEGTLVKCRQRSTNTIVALKKARVFPQGEGIPYYMLRELAVLQGMKHPNLAVLLQVSLANNNLFVLFDYVDKTLHDFINPSNDQEGGEALSIRAARSILHQLLDAIAYCHRRGVLHRNLKPKHLLIDLGPGVAAAAAAAAEEGTETTSYDRRVALEHARMRLSDFALTRVTCYPRRTYTSEVVTLWYRPPEILMGTREYTPAVDVWSIGCIFGEMALGKPLFTGISEIDQLFQMFNKLSTPTPETWPDFHKLPNQLEGNDGEPRVAFPNWKKRDPLKAIFSEHGVNDQGLDLLACLLTYDPARRITAEDALRHPFFVNPDSDAFEPLHSHTQAGDREPAPGSARALVLSTMGADGLPLPQTSSTLSTLLYCEYLVGKETTIWSAMSEAKRDYMRREDVDLRPDHRALLVDWLAEVVDVFDMNARTAFLAVNYTDRFIQRSDTPVHRNKLQLLGATCLHVASKCEDVSYIGVEDLAVCSDNVYTAVEVLRMEERLLNVLEFEFAVPTVLDFLSVYQDLMLPMVGSAAGADSMPSPLDDRTKFLAQYLSELSLQRYSFVHRFKPSLVAACTISLALYTTGARIGQPMDEANPLTCDVDGGRLYWPCALQRVSGFKLFALRECVEELHREHQRPQGEELNLSMIKKRYERDERMNVAHWAAAGHLDMF